MYGKKHSEKTKEIFKEINSGSNNPFHGKIHSDETKKRMSEARKKYWENKRKMVA